MNGITALTCKMRYDGTELLSWLVQARDGQYDAYGKKVTVLVGICM